MGTEHDSEFVSGFHIAATIFQHIAVPNRHHYRRTVSYRLFQHHHIQANGGSDGTSWIRVVHRGVWSLEDSLVAHRNPTGSLVGRTGPVEWVADHTDLEDSLVVHMGRMGSLLGRKDPAARTDLEGTLVGHRDRFVHKDLALAVGHRDRSHLFDMRDHIHRVDCVDSQEGSLEPVVEGYTADWGISRAVTVLVRHEVVCPLVMFGSICSMRSSTFLKLPLVFKSGFNRFTFLWEFLLKLLLVREVRVNGQSGIGIYLSLRLSKVVLSWKLCGVLDGGAGIGINLFWGLSKVVLVLEILWGLGRESRYWGRPGFQAQNQVGLLGCQVDCSDPLFVGWTVSSFSSFFSGSLIS